MFVFIPSLPSSQEYLESFEVGDGSGEGTEKVPPVVARKAFLRGQEYIRTLAYPGFEIFFLRT